jgi:hypothetical protein
VWSATRRLANSKNRGDLLPLRIPKKQWHACSRGRGADCRFAFTLLLIKLEFMERLAFLEKRTRLLFAQGALPRAQVSSLSFQ